MVRYHTRFFVIPIVMGECTVLLLQKYGFKVCAVLFGFWSSCLKFHIHLLWINTQRQITTPFYSWLPSSRVSLLCCYYEHTVRSFVWYCLVFIQLIMKFISICLASTHGNKQHQHLTSLTSYHLATYERQDCIKGQPISLR